MGRGIPYIDVLDPAGVIRYKDVHGDELTRAVEALLKDMK